MWSERTLLKRVFSVILKTTALAALLASRFVERGTLARPMPQSSADSNT